MTKLEKQWIVYDVANSAFTLLVSTVFPVYFKYLAENEHIPGTTYLAYWGYAVSISTLIVAFIGPVFGAVADSCRSKKMFFTISMLVGVISCAMLGTYQSWIFFLVVFVIAKTGYSSSLVFYDSMLPDVTEPDNMDNVSSAGYGLGYIGSTIPFIASLAIILMKDKIGLNMNAAMNIVLFINGIWWFLWSVPLIKNYRQIHFVTPSAHPVRNSFHNLKETFFSLAKEKKILVFLIAFFFYIDGVYTIIDMATAYGSAIGLDSTGLLLALLLTQFVAFPFAMLFAWLSRRIDAVKLIAVCIAGYVGIALYAFFLDKQYEFWILAVSVGIFQGGIQALSRSYYAKIIPAEKSGGYFGIMDICGKGAAFLGTSAMAFLTQLTGKAKYGVLAIAFMLGTGFILFLVAVKIPAKGDSRLIKSGGRA